jgi:hypothetical protein
MVGNVGAQPFAQNPYYWQQQVPPWMMGQQQPFAGGMGMGTRGVGEQQGQPLSPTDFGVAGQAGGIPGQVGQQFPTMQQQPGMQGPAMLSQQDRVALRGVLDILKEGRAALASGEISGEVAQRLTAGHSYLAGFLEAKGLAQLGTFIQSLPPLTTRGSLTEDPEYDEMVDELERVLNGQVVETRGLFSAFRKIVRKAPKYLGIAQRVISTAQSFR